MNTEGDIQRFHSETDAKAAGFDEPLTESEFKRLGPVSRKERRKALAELRGQASPPRVKAQARKRRSR